MSADDYLRGILARQAVDGVVQRRVTREAELTLPRQVMAS
jgi:hypothetical protein